MAKKKTTRRKTKPTYLREVEIKFKKKRVSGQSPVTRALTRPDLVVELFRDLQNEGKEKLIVISLDAKMKIIAFEVVSIGSPKAIYAQPGECTRTPIMVAATGMIVIHNHPSGDPEPSDEDKDFTWHLTAACVTLGIPLYDHIIIGDDDFYSFAQDGWIERFQAKAEKQIIGQRPKR